MIVYMICYAAGMLFSRVSLYALSGIVLMFAAAVLFLQDMRGPGLPVRLRALFSLSFVGGQGLACLKLSRLQTDWEWGTWAVLFLAYTGFWLAFEGLRLRNGPAVRGNRPGRLTGVRRGRLFLSIVLVTGISLLAFCAEASLLHYIPLLVHGVPHAYSWFHISGVHYFTVSCVLVPAMAAAWTAAEPGAAPREKNIVRVCVFLSFLIPVLCVSRSQMLLAAMFAGVTLLLTGKDRIPAWAGAAGAAVLLVFYVILTVARSHSVEYLNGIFEMKRNYPIFISQPYIYIANNYDNLNCLIRDLPAHTWGLRSLFPLWALSGLKFVFPQLAASPLYVTKTELTTLTLFYDAWYDFGTVGVVLFSAALGSLCYFLEKRIGEDHGPMVCVFFAQVAVYLGLSFFTTWFSNPTTWFYFAVTLAVTLFCGHRGS